MILYGIFFGIAGIALLFATMRGIFFIFLLAIGGVLGYIIIKHYFLAFLKVLNGIKERLLTNKYSPLEGLSSFLMLSYARIGITIILAFAQFAHMAGAFSLHSVDVTRPVISIDSYGNITYVTQETVAIVTEATVSPFLYHWSLLFAIVHGVGMFLCLRNLERYG